MKALNSPQCVSEYGYVLTYTHSDGSLITGLDDKGGETN
jgi:hypothetical protein